MKKPKSYTLFLAVTRPAMFAHIPIEVAAILGFVTAETLFLTHKPLQALGMGALGYAVCRGLVAIDHNIFRLIYLWGITKMRSMRNSFFWGGSSASPTSLRKPKHVTEIPTCLN